jgi:hypothetical protein
MIANSPKIKGVPMSEVSNEKQPLQIDAIRYRLYDACEGLEVFGNTLEYEQKDDMRGLLSNLKDAIAMVNQATKIMVNEIRDLQQIVKQ